jgi:hypothetical protein
LARRNDTNQEAHVAAIEERHLRRGGEQEGQAKHVAIERDTFFKVVDGDQELSDCGVGIVIAISDRLLPIEVTANVEGNRRAAPTLASRKACAGAPVDRKVRPFR